MTRCPGLNHGVPSFPRMAIDLTAEDRATLDGSRRRHGARDATHRRDGRGVAGRRLIDVTSAHIDGCLYHGRAGLDFADGSSTAAANVAIPTTLNVSSLDLLHPELVQLDPDTAAKPASLMDAYVSMGCRATWTCAPYQLPERPAFGEQVAWAESNAIVFANSVLGARTNRYGDFIDICARSPGGHRTPACTRTRSGAARGVPARGRSRTRLLHDEITRRAWVTSSGRTGGDRACPRSWGSRPNARGPPAGARGRGGLVGRGRDVPRGGRDPRGADPRGRDRRRAVRTRDRRHRRLCAPPATS